MMGGQGDQDRLWGLVLTVGCVLLLGVLMCVSGPREAQPVAPLVEAASCGVACRSDAVCGACYCDHEPGEWGVCRSGEIGAVLISRRMLFR
jgi:hypothetical protein